MTIVEGAAFARVAPDAEPSQEAAIVLRGVSKTFAARGEAGEVKALDGIELSVPRGQILGVIGRSGAGKSTLIRLINGLEKPSSGQVRVNGVEVSSLDESSLREVRRSIGMIFQHFNLLSSRTAFQNVALPLEIAGVPKREIRRIVEPLLETVGLSDKRDRYPSELSGGQKQRVGIARALATKPKVLLSDEATSALDPETTSQILALLRQINRDLGITVLFITHEMSVVKFLADRVAVMDGGRIVEQGATYDVFAHPVHETTRAFIDTVTGRALPDALAGRVRADPSPGASALLRVTFTGSEADTPVLSQVARRHDVDLNILHGRIDAVAGRPFGTLVVSATLDPAKLDDVIATLRETTHVELLGYVA
jgi:D-methionine transport system ATP-binding protein